MFILYHRAVAAKTIRNAALTALLGATALATPLHAQTPETGPPRHAAATRANRAAGETIEDRIAGLHASLKITPDEETQWSAVAQTMRDNEATMHKLAAEKRAAPSETMTAVDDLKAYQAFAQAHVDGLAKLITSFQTLYTTMPDKQKTLANQVFASFGNRAVPGRK